MVIYLVIEYIVYLILPATTMKSAIYLKGRDNIESFFLYFYLTNGSVFLSIV